MRPTELADDYASTISVLHHAVTAYESLKDIKVDYGCCIYATAPFVLPEYLKEGFDRLSKENDLDFAFSVTSFPFPIQRALIFDERNLVKMLQPEHENTRSQDLPECYHDAGQFYWFRPASTSRRDGMFSANSAPIVLPRERVQDIDTLEDWRCAELIHRMLEERDS
jgi:N-acylneuraminate cytidylyltransferase